MHDPAQDRAIVDARALQGAERDDELEAAEVERAEVGGDRRTANRWRGAGNISARDRQRAGAVIDADQRAVVGEPGHPLGQQRQLVASLDPEHQPARSPAARTRANAAARSSTKPGSSSLRMRA